MSTEDHFKHGEKDRQTDRQTDRQIDRQTDRDRERHRERQRFVLSILKFLGMKCTINAIYLGNDSVARLIQITSGGMAIENGNNS